MTAFSKTSLSDNETFIVSYVYDKLNRLGRENNARDSIVVIYLYDNAGNITSKKIFDYASYVNTDTLTLKNSLYGETVSYTYMTTGNKDRLLTYNGSGDLAYDSYGNPKEWFKHGINNSALINNKDVGKVSVVESERIIMICRIATGEKNRATHNNASSLLR